MKERIMVVDDHGDIADALARYLASLGYDAKAVYDGRTAAEEAARFLPDMMFIDIGMPEFDGYQTVAQIRANRDCGTAVLIALTGLSGAEHKQRAYESGFDLHVSKPLDFDRLDELLALVDPSRADSKAEEVSRLAKRWDKRH